MGMEMKMMERRRKRSHLSRRDEDVQQERPRKLQVRTKRIFLQQSPKVRAEDGLLARRPKKRSKMIMKRKKMVRMRRPLPRRPPVEVVQQAKRRKRQCTRRTVKKKYILRFAFTGQIQSGPFCLVLS